MDRDVCAGKRMAEITEVIEMAADMKTDLEKLKAWCCKQAELINELKAVTGFSDEVRLNAYSRDHLHEIHIDTGIEIIASALKRPVHINGFSRDMYKKTVAYHGVEFFQIGFCTNY